MMAMHILLLQLRRQWFLQPLLYHRHVLFFLTLGQLQLNFTKGSLVGFQVGWRSRCALQELECQLVYLLAVHGGHDIKV